MGNILSSNCNKNNYNEEKEKQFDINVIRKELMLKPFMNVIRSYSGWLLYISEIIVRKQTDNVEREKRKFNAVRKEFFNFLFQHRRYVTLEAIHLMSMNKSKLHTLTLNNSNRAEQLLTIDDAYELALKFTTKPEGSFTTLYCNFTCR